MSEKAGECGEYRHQRRGGDDLRDEGHADRLADALHMPGTEVEPDDRLDALLEAAGQDAHDLHQRSDDGDRRDVIVAAVALQPHVEHHVDQAFGDLHDEGCQTERQHGDDDPIEPDVQRPQANRAAPGGEEQYDPYGRDQLGEHVRGGRSPDAPSEHENEHGVKKDGYAGADEYGDHGHSGFALRRNEVVESERELHEYGADQVDGDEVDRIFDGRIAGAEGVENRPFSPTAAAR